MVQKKTAHQSADSVVTTEVETRLIKPRSLDYWIRDNYEQEIDTIGRYIINYIPMDNHDSKEIIKYQFIPPEAGDDFYKINYKTSVDTTFYYGKKYRFIISDMEQPEQQLDTLEITRTMLHKYARIPEIDRYALDGYWIGSDYGETLVIDVRLTYLPIYNQKRFTLRYHVKARKLFIEEDTSALD